MTSRLRIAALFYGALSVAAVAWAVLRGDPGLYFAPGPWFSMPRPQGTVVGAAAGLLVGAATVFATRVLLRRADWARVLHEELRHRIGPLSPREILVLALASGIAEELFFRGAMQPSFGVFLTGVVFGLIHIPSGRRMIPWTLWAIVMGWIFGALHELTGELIAPVVAHVWINDRNLRLLQRPRPPQTEADAAEATR